MRHVQLREGITIGIPEPGDPVQITDVSDNGSGDVIIWYASAAILRKVTITDMSERYVSELLGSQKAEDILKKVN